MWNKKLWILPALMILTFVSSCGSDAYRENPQPTQTSAPAACTGSACTTTSTVPSTDPVIPMINAGIFTISGSGGTTPSFQYTVTTDSILKVKITAGRSDRLSLSLGSGYSNFNAVYGCVTYTVTAAGQNFVTQPLSPEDNPTSTAPGCQGAPHSQTFDFSDHLGRGRSTVTVTVDQPRYDFYCQWWTNCQGSYNPSCYYSFPPSSYSAYCPLRSVYRNHSITGKMEIQVNTTVGP